MFDGRRSILVIDDEPALRDALVAALDSVRFRLVVAAGVPAAARLCRGAMFDLIICARVDTLACFRVSMRSECGERHVLVLTTAGHSRPWTMTKHVRFVHRPAGAGELRELLMQAGSYS